LETTEKYSVVGNRQGCPIECSPTVYRQFNSFTKPNALLNCQSKTNEFQYKLACESRAAIVESPVLMWPKSGVQVHRRVESVDSSSALAVRRLARFSLSTVAVAAGGSVGDALLDVFDVAANRVTKTFASPRAVRSLPADERTGAFVLFTIAIVEQTKMPCLTQPQTAASPRRIRSILSAGVFTRATAIALVQCDRWCRSERDQAASQYELAKYELRYSKIHGDLPFVDLSCCKLSTRQNCQIEHCR